MSDPFPPDDADEFEIVSEYDPVAVEGIRRGLADSEAGRFQSLEEFDAEFRSQFGIAANDGDAEHKIR